MVKTGQLTELNGRQTLLLDPELRRREEDEEERRPRRVGLGRALLLALMTAAAAFLAAHIRCGYDLPALLLWAAAIVLDMVAPERSRREERAEG